jgi:hypothetical protein
MAAARHVVVLSNSHLKCRSIVHIDARPENSFLALVEQVVTLNSPPSVAFPTVCWTDAHEAEAQGSHYVNGH